LAGGDHRQAIRECGDRILVRILRADLGERNVGTDRLGPATNQAGITEQIERRQRLLPAALPGLDGDVGPDACGFA
jgi:hypothetical protein